LHEPLGDEIRNITPRPDLRDFGARLLIGTALGTIVLGAGGRLAMRVFALATGAPPGFSLGGSGTVVFLGAVSGAAGAAILSAARWLFPRQRAARALGFWGVIGFLTLRGLHPVDPLRLAIFVPVIVAFGALLQAVWCRWYLPRRAALPQGAPSRTVEP
jgi:hypothetical protein